MIIFQPPTLSNSLKVDRRGFLSLVHEDDNYYTANLTYHIRQSSAVQESLNRVRITAYSSFLLPERYINDPSRPTDTINSLLTYATRNIRLEKNQRSLMIGQAIGDIFGSIDKRVFTQLSSGKLPSEISELKRTVIRTELRSADTNPLKRDVPSPINPVDDNDKLNFSLTGRDLIRKDGIDPAKALKQFTLKQSKTGLKKGIVETKTQTNNFKIARLEKTLSSRVVPTTESVTYSISETQEFIQIKTPIKIKKMNSGVVQFRFELLSSESDIPVDIQEYSANIEERTSTLRWLFLPPEVTQTRSKNGITFGLRQTNRHGTSILIYSKRSPVGKTTNTTYEFLGRVTVPYNQERKFFIQDRGDEDRLFRFICANDGQTSPAFESLVSRKLPSLRNKSGTNIFISYTDSFDFPIKATTRELPETSRTAQFMIKNLTKKWTLYKEAGDILNLSPSNTVATAVIKNRGFRSGDSLQIICKIQHLNGLYSTYGGDIFTFHDPRDRDKSLYVELTNEDITEDDITFVISDGMKETQTQFVKNILTTRGDFAQFQAEIEENKSDLKNVIAYHIERLNMDTGLRENMGLSHAGVFSDRKASNLMGVQPANKLQRYRYFIKALSANPEILFGSYRKEVKDKCETKIYTYFPSRFLNFWALKRGMIPSNIKNTLTTSYSGITKIWDYIPAQEETNPPLQIEASLLNQDYIQISFAVTSAGQFFDHFVLSKVVNGDKTIIDTIHSQFTSGQNYLYRVGPLDQGEILFTLTTVKNDYTISSEILSNTLSL